MHINIMSKWLTMVLVCGTVAASEELTRRYFPAHSRPFDPALNHPLNIQPLNDISFQPAQYDFRYDVEAPEYGSSFGHQEMRQGDVVRGRYYVMLPGGHLQVVDYVADQHGYRPTISYQAGEFIPGSDVYHRGGGLYRRRKNVLSRKSITSEKK